MCCSCCADSHSSTLLLTRLAQLYRQRPLSSNSSMRPGWRSTALPPDVIPSTPRSASGFAFSAFRSAKDMAVNLDSKKWTKTALLASADSGKITKSTGAKKSTLLKVSRFWHAPCAVWQQCTPACVRAQPTHKQGIFACVARFPRAAWCVTRRPASVHLAVPVSP